MVCTIELCNGRETKDDAASLDEHEWLYVFN